MKKLAILYFSSTGNSLYVAKKIKERLSGKIIYIPKYNGTGEEFDKIIIVTPIYSYGLPVPVFDLLLRLTHEKEIIVIQTYGGMVGHADRLFYEYALKNGLNIKSVYTLKMPENFTLVMSPPKFLIDKVLKTADKRINSLIDKICHKQYIIPKDKKTREQKYLKNKGNWYLIGKRFSVNDRCILCQKCLTICPANNISLVNGKIVFSDKCQACLGCFHRCPKHAIIYKGRDNKKRYINPYIDENEIGKDD